MVETLIMQAFNGISLSSILFLAAIGLAVTFVTPSHYQKG